VNEVARRARRDGAKAGLEAVERPTDRLGAAVGQSFSFEIDERRPREPREGERAANQL
jgi:hypothetical protein